MSETSEKMLSTKMHSPRTSTESSVLEVFNGSNNSYGYKNFKIRFSFDENTGVARILEHTEYGSLDEPFVSNNNWKDYVERRFFIFMLEHTPAQTIKGEDGAVLAQIEIHNKFS